jgi:hypothetical protein
MGQGILDFGFWIGGEMGKADRDFGPIGFLGF